MIVTGLMTDMRVYSRALSSAEIAAIYADPYGLWDAGEEEWDWAKAAAAAGNPHWYYNMLKQRRRAC